MEGLTLKHTLILQLNKIKKKMVVKPREAI